MKQVMLFTRYHSIRLNRVLSQPVKTNSMSGRTNMDSQSHRRSQLRLEHLVESMNSTVLLQTLAANLRNSARLLAESALDIQPLDIQPLLTVVMDVS